MASSSQAKRGEEVTRFFRIILQHAIVAKKLMIPRKFIRENGQQLLGCDAATLEVPTGDKWDVGLKTDRRGFVWFCSHGWEEFTEFYSLDIGHFLLFQYKGHSDNFSVVICDRSAVEIDYPTLSRAANVGRAVEIESEDDSLSVEILDDVDAAANKRDVGKGKAPMVDDGHSALQIEIKKGHLSYGHQSRIPFRFIERHPFMRDVEQMVLEVGDKVWKVRLALAYNKYVSFAAGWTKFAKDNSLNLGDVCVFKMVTMSPDVRMKKKKSHNYKEAATMEDEFEIEIKRCHLISQQRRIPSSFIKEHAFMRDAKQAKLEVGDKVWPVRLCTMFDKYVNLGAGWIRFARDNSLELGDVCVFEVITTSPGLRMKVTITKGV
ncbi:B3 domain-containing protein At3g18960 [Linum grandiflorum]